MEIRQRKPSRNQSKSSHKDQELLILEESKYKKYFLPLLILSAIFTILLIYGFFVYNTEDLVPYKGKCYYHKDAKSALNRAKSHECKANLEKIACSQNSLYPTVIEPSCDFYQKLPYLGCFRDQQEFRILNNGSSKVNLKSINSPEECARFCFERRFALAGVQYGHECFCGDSVDEKFKISEKKCDQNCPGNPDSKCGGFYTMNVYKVTK